MYVVYNKETTRYLKNHVGVKSDKTHFETTGAAKAALTRAVKQTALNPQPINADDFAIADSLDFHKNIEKQVPVQNLMSGGTVMQSANTPRCCDVSSEAYWSM
jgi:hypothetical protein